MIYEIEQYETHTQRYRVEANSEAEAIQKLLAGEATAIDGSLEYVEVNEERGLPVEENRELVDELAEIGVHVGDCVIESIARVWSEQSVRDQIHALPEFQRLSAD